MESSVPLIKKELTNICVLTANLVFSQSTKCRQQANSFTPYRLNSHRTYPHYIPLQPALQGFLIFIACLFWTKLRLGECRGKVFFYYAEPKQVRRRQQQPMCYVSSVAVFMIEQHYILSCYGFFRCKGSYTRLSTRTSVFIQKSPPVGQYFTVHSISL